MNRHSETKATLERIEQIIEQLEPGSTIRISDITGQLGRDSINSDITKATIMMFQKYGIIHVEGN